MNKADTKIIKNYLKEIIFCFKRVEARLIKLIQLKEKQLRER